jgi:hypothetical protein
MTMRKALSKIQQQWLDHNQAAEKSHLSLSAYAKQHQLNIKALYNYRNILREKGLIANSNTRNSTKPKTSSFIQVRPRTISDPDIKSTSPVIIKLPNDIQLEISCSECEVTQLIERLIAI